MKYFIITLLFGFLFPNLSGQEQLPSIDKSFEELISKYQNVGVASAYTVNGEVVWSSSNGYSDRDQQTPFTDTTLTRIASITKPMTAICIMQLVEEGKLSLDDEVRKFITDFPSKKRTTITVRHLLTHTSGIKGYKKSKEAVSAKEYDTLQDVLNVFKDRKLKFEPGTDFYYTTYGYVVLGLIIEKLSGFTYEEYLQKNILDPAGMKRTGVEKYGTKYDGKSEIYHMKKGKVISPKQNNLSNRIPAGGLYSTVEDLLSFGNAVINHTLIKEETMNTMLEVGFPAEGNPYGLGWFLYGPKDDYQAYFGHEGGQYGGNTQLIIAPKTKSTIVVLSNTSETPKSNVKQFAVLLLRKIITNFKFKEN